jgi:nucleotide-binding universal stress UspA family protein
MQLRTIFVATDFSPVSRNAFDAALALARAARARVVVVHVVAFPVPIRAGVPVGILQEIARASDRLRAGDERRLEKLVARARGAGLAARGVLDEGDPAERLMRIIAKERPDVIVTGTHGRGGAAHLLLGSVAERIVREAPCSVMVVRRRGRKGGPVLAALDSSPAAVGVASSAAWIAERMRARLLAVHAMPAAVIPDPVAGGLVTPVYRRVAAIGRRQVAKELLEKLRKGRVPIDQRALIVKEGRPQDAILETVRKLRPALTVTGTHARRGLARILLGSVAEAVVRRAGLPVLVIRARRG